MTRKTLLNRALDTYRLLRYGFLPVQTFFAYLSRDKRL
jgi:hypothetical protein